MSDWLIIPFAVTVGIGGSLVIAYICDLIIDYLDKRDEEKLKK